MRLIDGIPVFCTEVDSGALSQIQTCRKTADRVALMADSHKGYAVPIGGVVAYKNSISPSGVGFDIGCGNKAVRLDVDPRYVRENIQRIMDEVFAQISFGVGRANNERVESYIFDEMPEAWALDATNKLKHLAEDQLGTVGSGNHYVDIFEDELGRIWIGVHFGSRGLGHKTATWFLNAAGAKDGMDVAPCVIDAASDLGIQYIHAMTLAGAYAYAGRDWVCSKVARIIGSSIVEEVHNHHNFAWREAHDGEDYWVVRKGATPAWPGQRGFVGGSMGENAVIIEGASAGAEVTELQNAAMFSTVHGAGRIMGRREAKGKTRWQAQWKCQDYRRCSYTAPKGGFFKEENGPTPKCPQCGHKLRLERAEIQMSPGKVTQEMMNGWLQRGGVTLRGGGLDESPDCYKRLPEVLREHAGTINILHTLKPLGVAMAGADVVDPFKD